MFRYSPGRRDAEIPAPADVWNNVGRTATWRGRSGWQIMRTNPPGPNGEPRYSLWHAETDDYATANMRDLYNLT